MPEIVHDPEFWVAVAFVIAVSIMLWKGSASVAAMLDGRAAKIREDLAEAARLHDEAKKTLAEYQRRQREALDEAKQIAVRAKEEAEQLAAEAAQELEIALKRREQLAHERIAQAETAALAEVRGVAVDVAIAATRQLILQSLDQQSGAALIDDAIKVLPQKLH
jgi:F-type H+-transporting ATPase subunit b